MNTVRYISVVLAAILGLGAAMTGFAQTTAKGVPVKLVVGKDDKEVDLVGREKDVLFYRPRGGPEGASTTVKFQDITSAEFVIELDEEGLAKALMAENWPAAAVLLIPVATPLLPYLDIPENNGVGLAMQAGQCLIKSARNLVKAGGSTNLDRSTNVFLRAYQVLNAVGVAKWTPDAERAHLNAVQCLIAVGNLETAARDLEAARVPDAGDECYGLYWLTRAQFRYAKGQTRSAMDAVIKSIVFENKDIETFPDALLLSGRCYEDLLDFHRARDVYYEVARLFPTTGYADTAREKLKYLMDKGLTKDKETSPVEVVFFGLDEDVNAKVLALLNGEDEKAPTVEEPIDSAEENEPATKKTDADGAPEAPPPLAAPPPKAAPPAPAPRPDAAVKHDTQGTTHKTDHPKAGTQH